jgi:hypothetical protein
LIVVKWSSSARISAWNLLQPFHRVIGRFL